MRAVFAGRTDRGRIRPRNEDALLQRPERGLAVVADGMGGHAAGDIASRIAIDILDDHTAAGHTGGDTGARLEAAIRAAHDAVLRAAAADPALTGMGTTLTALWIPPAPAPAAIAHVGDSRAYRLRGDAFARLTRDQTWVQDQVDAGALTVEAARKHRYAAVLTSALGAGERELQVQVIPLDPEPGDLFLLCSDGLTARLDDDAIRRIVAGEPDPHAAADALVDAANRAGGPDNTTVALVRIDAGDLSADQR